MGARKSTYERFAPSHSFIHVDDFASAQHLAYYLQYLDNNDKEYNKYFEWKGSGQVMGIMMWCRVCAMLHAPNRVRFYHNINRWWSGSDHICVDNVWNSSSTILTENIV
jgi:glycoprotein 3-alpha-L-fucosyltransferase